MHAIAADDNEPIALGTERDAQRGHDAPSVALPGRRARPIAALAALATAALVAWGLWNRDKPAPLLPETSAAPAIQSPSATSHDVASTRDAAAPTAITIPDPVAPTDSSLGSGSALPPQVDKVTTRPEKVTAASKHREGRSKIRTQNQEPVGGEVVFHVRPWADVYWQGKHLGLTPFTDPVRLPSGRQTLTLKNKDLNVSRNVVVTIAPDARTVVGAVSIRVENAKSS